MGMYTELDICCHLKKETPDVVISALRLMLKEAEYGDPPKEVAEHDLFKTESWRWMLHGESAYFGKGACSFLTKSFQLPSIRCKLQVTANIKNYDDEWERFIEFIEPWIATEGYIGTYRYEESSTPICLLADPEGGFVEWRRLKW